MPEDFSQLSFEQAYAELENLVQALEDNQLPLEEALALFERGQALAAHCQALLEKAALRVQQISPTSGELTDIELD